MFYVEHFSFSTVGNKPDGDFRGRDKKTGVPAWHREKRV